MVEFIRILLQLIVVCVGVLVSCHDASEALQWPQHDQLGSAKLKLPVVANVNGLLQVTSI